MMRLFILFLMCVIWPFGWYFCGETARSRFQTREKLTKVAGLAELKQMSGRINAAKMFRLMYTALWAKNLSYFKVYCSL